MNLNSTPNAEQIQTGFWGMRNVGKIRLMNALIGQDISVTSFIKGVTTDSVKKLWSFCSYQKVA